MILKTDDVYEKDMKLNHEEIILGRENEINCIIKHFDAVLEGAFAACVLSGEAGVGKTYMITETAKRLVNLNVTYVCGKFKHYNNSLFSPLNEIFSSLVEHAMTFSDDKLKTLKRLLHKKLKEDSNLIIDICPNAEKLLGYYRKINEEDYHRLEYKFFNAIVAFLDIMSQELYPLMIHIDDIQWSDEGSVRMIDFLMKKRNLNFYLMLSLREDPTIVNRMLIDTESILSIKLNRFNMSETQAYIQHLINAPIAALEDVTRLIYKATLGNPFYIKKLIESIIKDENVKHTENEYQIDLEFLRKLQLSEDIQAILKHQIQALSSIDYKFLQLLACIGGAIDHILIDKLFSREDHILTQLDNICHTGLLVKDALSDNYYFSHDIIYEILYQSMSKTMKIEHHFSIANKLIDDPDKIYIAEQRIFISLQLLGCMNRLLKVEDSTKYVLELYHSGIKAKQVTLIDDAIKFLEAALVLLSLSDDSITANLVWKIRLELTECLFLAGYHEAAEHELNQFVKMCDNKEDIVNIKSRFILLYTYEGEYDKVIVLGREVLNDLGYNINTQNIKFSLLKEITKCRLLLSNKKISAIQHKPAIDDCRILKIEVTLIRMAAVANLIDEDLFALLILKLSALSIKYGNSELASPAFATYSYILYHFIGDKNKAVLFKELSIDVLVETDHIKCMSYFILGTFVEHWDHAYEKSVIYLEEALSFGIKSGEFQYAGYAFSSLLEMNLIMQHSVNEILETITLLDQYDERLRHDVLKNTLFILENHLGLLIDAHANVIDDKTLQLMDASQRLTFYYYKLQRLYLAGAINYAFKLLSVIEPIKGMFKGYMFEVDLNFYSTLIRLEQHQSLGIKEQIKNRFLIDRSIKKFKKWMKRCKDNHLARFCFMKSLYAEKFGDSTQAGLLYEQGLSFARKKNQYLLVAVGCMLSSKYYIENSTVSNVYRKEAVQAFEAFGSNYLSELYEEKLCSKSSASKVVVNHETQEIMAPKKQLGTLMRHVEGLDKDATYLYLLDLLIKENRADYGAVFFENNDQIYMTYVCEKGALKSCIQSVLIDDVTSIPHKVIRYVTRTNQDVVMNKKPYTGLFVNDTYFEEITKLSLLCMPIKYMDVFVGIVYLEWHDEFKTSETLIDEINSYMPLLITKTVPVGKVKSNRLDSQEGIPLTKREIEVFKLMIKGLTNKQIGEELFISLSTVKTHIINIYSKLHIKNRVAAVGKAKQYGYMD